MTASGLVAVLRERGWTLGVAESLTGGAVTSEIVSVPGASVVLLGGVVAYATQLKRTLLGVDAALLAAHGPVHPEVARQMADGVRRAVAVDGRAADIGIATTGIAGPESPDGQPVGTVHVGVATPGGVRAAAHVFTGSRAEIRCRAVEAAIALALQAAGE
ncbi:nicotinamide-nucleotide amidohydrolase family protein [Microbacterium soli]|uniref:CinA family protein n=1 Tax=Microbacterium soli TaxID=446075 RepID=A0ABP7MQ77_9MICO